MTAQISEKLAKLQQSHLLKYLDELPEAEQHMLLRQIESLDLSVLDEHETTDTRGQFAPLYAKTLAEIEQHRAAYTQLGLQTIRDGKVGAVLLAGGQGSRLGFNKPKGMFNIGVTRELYIFQCLMQNLMEVTTAAEAPVPLFIMTSTENHDETRAFFAAHDYFGYSREHIHFFMQEQLPTVDPDGKLMLSAKHIVSTAPNGNGGWYASMLKTGMLHIIQECSVEWLNVFAVDNVLQRIADPCFIGAVIQSGMVSGAKVVAKADPEEKVGVLCLEDGKPSIVEYYEMTKEMRTRREPDGTLSYRFGVILNYLFRVDRLNETLDIRLPLHRAFKKIPYLNEDGNLVLPEEPNAYKFETLALDMVRLQENCLAYEVERRREFAPVKNKTGVDSVDTARALLQENGVQL